MKELRHSFTLNPSSLVRKLTPETFPNICDYRTWGKSRESLFSIEHTFWIGSFFKIIPSSLPGIVYFHDHHFPLFSKKRDAEFYGCLTILLSVHPQTFFGYVTSCCQIKGMIQDGVGVPRYILIETKSVSPFAFLYILDDAHMFGFFDSKYQIIPDSILTYKL